MGTRCRVDKIEQNNKYRIQVVGSFCSGKSTFINSLLGGNVLPSSPLPSTVIRTEVKWGNAKKSVIHFKNPLPDKLPSGIPEKALQHMQKHNMKGVSPIEISYDELAKYTAIQSQSEWDGAESPYEKIEVFWPHLILKDGVEIIDSVGLRECDVKPNVRMNYLSQANAVIFLMDATRVCTYDEMRVLQYISKEKGVENTFIVVNKFEEVPNEDKDDFLRFIHDKLDEFTANTIFCVSALNALKSKLNNDQELLNSSNISKVENALLDFLVSKKSATTDRANRADNSNLFDLKNFDEVANLESHLSFAEELISKYEWNKKNKKKFQAQLNQIKRKQEDKLLNLSVVGEFGTGKSTFINAMLRRDNFLVSSALQGTTVAATIIEHSEKYGISLTYTNGKKMSRNYHSIDQLKSALISFTTDPSIAKKLYSVNVQLPSTPLSSGFRIIDTPGTNANERWHEDVTIRTIQEMSDIAILIIDANKPMSESFCNFVRSNLSDMLPQCVFVATRMDMIRKRERDGILDYLQMKISQEFGLSNPIVLPYAAIDVLDTDENGECSELAALSFKSETQMLSHMMRLKIVAQTKKLISLIDAMYLSISEKMADLSDGYKNELDFLLRSQQTDLKPFVEQQICQRTESFQNTARSQRNAIVQYFEQQSNQAYANVMSKVDSLNSIDELQKFIDSELSELCLNEAQKIVANAETKYSSVYNWFKEEMIEFGRAFEELFADLDILSVDLKHEKISIPTSVAIKTTDLSEASKYIAEQLSSNNKSVFGGAAAGAAVGTAIAPGVGTIIGGIIGLFGGAVFAPDVGEVKKTTKEKLSTPLKGYFSDVVYRATKGFDDYVTQVGKCIPTEINKYLTSYHKIVTEQIANEKKKITTVEEKIASLKTDMDSISKRKFALQSLSNQLNILCGKEF